MRVFIAAPCPQDAKAELAKAAEKVGSFGDMKIVPEENMHLTLRFLGEVDEGMIESLTDALGRIKRPRGFDVCIKGLGAFPSPGAAKVVWAGVEKGGEELKELNAEIENAVASLGFAGDERFSSHYTIARVRYLKDVEGLRTYISENREKAYGCFHMDSFHLMKSVLQRSGPVYSVVKTLRL